MDSELILQTGDVIRIGEKTMTILAVQRSRIVVSVEGEDGIEELVLAPTGRECGSCADSDRGLA
jgi:hypothetical protein